MQHILENKHILVTGASSGIGKSTTEALVQLGAKVYGASRHPEKIPSGAIPLFVDLLEEKSIETLFNQITQLDSLVNNAGIAKLSTISEGNPKDWEEMWRVNVHALALCCKHSVTKMNDGGHVLNVSSLSGHRVPPTGGFYAPTKFAVTAVSQALRSELRSKQSKIRVSSISPGFVDTPILDGYFQGREEQLAQTKASMTMLQPEDISQSILHILSTPSHVEIGDIFIRSVDQSV